MVGRGSCEYTMLGCDPLMGPGGGHHGGAGGGNPTDLFVGPLGHLHFRPRLFIPHYEQCKLLFSEKTSESMSTSGGSAEAAASMFSMHHQHSSSSLPPAMSVVGGGGGAADMPDALYMVNKTASSSRSMMCSLYGSSRSAAQPLMPPQPADSDNIEQMVSRIQKLYQVR